MSLSNTLVLPDSRLSQRPDLCTVMADWPMPDGSTVRVEMAPIYCANCGTLFGHVPLENCTFAFWLCRDCFAKWGEVAGTYAVPEDEFNQAVAAEMQDRFGRTLTHVELWQLEQQGQLGTALEKLARESPYPNPE